GARAGTVTAEPLPIALAAEEDSLPAAGWFALVSGFEPLPHANEKRTRRTGIVHLYNGCRDRIGASSSLIYVVQQFGIRRIQWRGGTSFLYTFPSFITNTILRTAVTSVRGSPSRAMMSACIPGAMVPIWLAMPSDSAAVALAATSAATGS